MIGLLEHALELQEQFADWFQKVFSKWTAGSSLTLTWCYCELTRKRDRDKRILIKHPDILYAKKIHTKWTMFDLTYEASPV